MSSHQDTPVAGADSAGQNEPQPGMSVLCGSCLPSLFLETNVLLEETFMGSVNLSVSVFCETQRTKQASPGRAQS